MKRKLHANGQTDGQTDSEMVNKQQDFEFAFCALPFQFSSLYRDKRSFIVGSDGGGSFGEILINTI